MINMFDCLTTQEQNMIKDYIETYSGEEGYGKETRASLSHILRFWDQNKKPIFDMFNRQFIISKSVSYSKVEDELIQEMNTVMHREGKTFRREFSEKITHNSNLDRDDRTNLCCLLAIDTIVNNIYNDNSFSIVNSEGKKLTISKGMKTMKALRKVADFFNLEGFEDFRLAHSLVLNQKKLEGTLHLSIHPLDFMTMSDNDSDWDSCMSWTKGGSYRRGTIEMMNSPMVVVGYLTTDSTMRMPGGETWNDKKWRELFIVDRKIITNVLGYPYRNESLTKECLNWLRELSPYADEFTSSLLKYNTNEETWCEELNENIRISPWAEVMYNDFHNGHFAFLNKNKELWIKDSNCFNYTNPATSKIVINESAQVKYIFNYSGPAVCMCCGSEYNDFPSEGALCCYDCEPVECCEICGEYSTEELVEIDGQLVCPYCYDESMVVDALTGEPHLNTNCEEVYVAFSREEVLTNVNYYIYYDNFDLPHFNVKQIGYYTRKIVMINDLPEDFFGILGYRSKENFINDNIDFAEDWSNAEWDD